MQAFPRDWNEVLDALFKNNMIKSSENTEHIENGVIELNTRINFKFDQNRYLEIRGKRILLALRLPARPHKFSKT